MPESSFPFLTFSPCAGTGPRFRESTYLRRTSSTTPVFEWASRRLSSLHTGDLARL